MDVVQDLPQVAGQGVNGMTREPAWIFDGAVATVYAARDRQSRPSTCPSVAGRPDGRRVPNDGSGVSSPSVDVTNDCPCG